MCALLYIVLLEHIKFNMSARTHTHTQTGTRERLLRKTRMTGHHFFPLAVPK